MKKAATKKAASPKATDTPETKAKKVSVRVVNPGGIHEDGERHECGAVFTIDAARARSLGDTVEAAE